MRAINATQRSAGRNDVDPESIRIGKDVIEIMTSGMYVSPIAIYREYVQNAVDSIDEARAKGLLRPNERGQVSIDIDHEVRSITIRDNGAGIAASDALPVLLAIGASPKRGTRARGFRGVGRLSALAYCRELEFRTKEAGADTMVSVTWDCRALRERLSDPGFGGDLKRIISDVASVWYERATDHSEHFFEVRMLEVARLRNDVLLNERLISNHLSQVAPVPFADDFTFGAKIEEKLATIEQHIPIALTVAGGVLNRPHHDHIAVAATSRHVRIHDIEFVNFADVDGETGALGWIGHHDYARSLPVGLGVAGLRARFGDLQVGDASLFENSFKEPRFNSWTIGEIHVFDRRLVPNARRDNFELNHHHENLLVQLGPLAARITQRCRSASVSRNAAQAVKNAITEVNGRLKERRTFDRAELSRCKSAVLRARATVTRISDAKLRQSLEKKLNRIQAHLAKKTPKRGASVVAFDEITSLVSKLVTNREQARKLIEALLRVSG